MLIRKIQKIRKIKSTTKKKRVEGPSWKPSNIFTYKYWSPQHTEGGQFCILRRQQKQKPNPKPIFFKQTSRPPHQAPLYQPTEKAVVPRGPWFVLRTEPRTPAISALHLLPCISSNNPHRHLIFPDLLTLQPETS